MTTEKKFLITIALATVLIISAGTFAVNKMAKPQSANTTLGEATADRSVLVGDARNSIGDPNAPVTIVEFSDFQCPACKAAKPIVEKIIENNKDKVYFVYRHYPLSTHKNSRPASQASEAAAAQGKFWEMHNLIFENQSDWENSSNPKEIFTDYAKQLELNIEQFEKDMDSFKDPVNQDFADGNKAGINSTPTFFINGQKRPGVIDYQQFQTLIDQTSSAE